VPRQAELRFVPDKPRRNRSDAAGEAQKIYIVRPGGLDQMKAYILPLRDGADKRKGDAVHAVAPEGEGDLTIWK
jgi:hypothetical protein